MELHCGGGGENKIDKAAYKSKKKNQNHFTLNITQTKHQVEINHRRAIKMQIFARPTARKIFHDVVYVVVGAKTHNSKNSTSL